MNQRRRHALISVSNKTDVIGFAEALVKLGFTIVSTGGTAKHLRAAQIPVTDVETITGFPEILGGRVKTLHPKIHGGILARPIPEHDSTLKEHDIPFFEIVCVNLYPFEATVAKPNVTLEAAIEDIDIGGVALLRAAAKNYQSGVTVICDPADYQRVAVELHNCRLDSDDLRAELAVKAFHHVAGYDAAIDEYMAGQQNSDQAVTWSCARRVRELAYSENRDQNPAFLNRNEGADDDPLALHRFRVLSGDPSYIAMADLDAGIATLRRAAEAFRRNANGRCPYIAVVCKHGNPCGAGFDWTSPTEALFKALDGDPLAVMGGELVTNFPIDDPLGRLIYEVPSDHPDIGRKLWGLDLIAAPEISAATVELLGKREKRRLLTNPALLQAPLPTDLVMRRPVCGGTLEQRAPYFIIEDSDHLWLTGKRLLGQQLDDLIFAWAICWTASSNTVILVKDGMMIGRGIGQQDRVACVRLCLQLAARSRHDTNGSVFASDAFFPFATGRKDTETVRKMMNEVEAMLSQLRLNPLRSVASEYHTLAKLTAHLVQVDTREGPDLLIDAGCVGGVVPYDGQHKDKVREYFAQAGLAVAWLPAEHRGFCRH